MLCPRLTNIFRDLGERLGLAYTLKDLARLKFEQGQYERATELGQESLALSRELGNRRGICFALAALARGARRRGEYAHAADLLRQVLVIWQELGNRPHIANSLAGLGALAAVQHQPVRAARLFGAAETEREAVGASLSRPELLVDVGYDESVATARKALGERAFADAWAAGRGLPRDEAIDEALSATAAVSSRRSGGQGGAGDGGIMRLSDREREIAVLIAEGWSNPEIAAALVIAARTADTHVATSLQSWGCTPARRSPYGSFATAWRPPGPAEVSSMPQIGGKETPPVRAADVRRVAIVGAGRVGHSIAQQFAAAGYIVSLQDRTDEHLERALRSIRDDLGQLESTGHLSGDGLNRALSRIRLETNIRAAVDDADIILEAVFEDLALKQSVFRDLDALAPAHAILASNTSSFVPSVLASVTDRADRVLVAHWFNPPHLLPLVELVRGSQTSDATIETMRDLLRGIGKRPAIVEKETPGFVANRLQFALLREALSIVEQGIASPEDVDTIITEGFGRRLAAAGVFENFDLAGWDLILAVAEQLWPLIDARREVSPLLRERVERSERGVKDGQGFYAWSAASAEELRQRIRAVLLAVNDLA